MYPYHSTQIGPWYAGRSRDEASLIVLWHELMETALDVGGLACYVTPGSMQEGATSEIRLAMTRQVTTERTNAAAISTSQSLQYFQASDIKTIA